jgi:biopolymer transport protein ExbD
MGGSRQRRGQMINNINVTPLCDILLVLLIIFMVASTYIVAQTLKVELPKSASSDGSSDTPLTMVLEHKGAVRWNGEVVTETVLREQIAGAVAENEEAELIISADAKVTHGRVVHFIDIAKLAGITKFAINVEQAPE